MPRALYSSTSVWVDAVTRSTVSGSPISLLNEPAGATVSPAAPKTAASRSFVEVLPDEPVTPTTRVPVFASTPPASAPSADSVSATTTDGASTGRSATAATAPAATAAAA